MSDVVVDRKRTNVKLIKNTKGYQWEISVNDDDHALVLATIKLIDDQLKTQYKSEE